MSVTIGRVRDFVSGVRRVLGGVGFLLKEDPPTRFRDAEEGIERREMVLELFG